MDSVLAEMMRAELVEVIGSFEDGEPDLAVTLLGFKRLTQLGAGDQARFASVIDERFCGHPQCRRLIRPGFRGLRVTIATETVDVVRPDLGDSSWSRIFCSLDCAHAHTANVFRNLDRFMPRVDLQ